MLVHKNFFKVVLIFFSLTIVSLNVISYSPTHPLSDITPMDVPLELDGQSIQSGDSENVTITEMDNLVIDSQTRMYGELFMEGNNVLMRGGDVRELEDLIMQGGIEMDGGDLVGVGDISSGGDVLLDGGTVSGLRLPSESDEAATRGYVDSASDVATQDLENVLYEGNISHEYGMELRGNDIVMDGGDLVGVGDISSGGDVLLDGGTVSGLVSPSESDEAATRGYVDSQIVDEFQDLESVLSEGHVSENYDIDMSGNELLDVGGLEGEDVVSGFEIEDGAVGLGELYLGEVDGRYVEVVGDEMSGELDMGGNVVSGLVSPSESDEAATRGYVDSQIVDEFQDLESVLSEGHVAGNQHIDMDSSDITNVGDLDVENDIEINEGQATGTNNVKGTRELYAGDETFINNGDKELTLVFDSEFSHNPSYVNILARISGDDSVDVTISGEGISGEDEEVISFDPDESGTEPEDLEDADIMTASVDTSDWEDGTYDVKVDITGDNANDIIEFFYVM